MNPIILSCIEELSAVKKINKEKLKTGLPKTHETSYTTSMRTSVSVQSTNFIPAIRAGLKLEQLPRQAPFIFLL